MGVISIINLLGALDASAGLVSLGAESWSCNVGLDGAGET